MYDTHYDEHVIMVTYLVICVRSYFFRTVYVHMFEVCVCLGWSLLFTSVMFFFIILYRKLASLDKILIVHT